MFSGVSNPVIKGTDLGVPATYEGMQAIGSGLGAVGFIVYDDTADMVSVSRLFARFLPVESCGQCGACKLNSGEVWSALKRLETGAANGWDIEKIGSHLEMVTDQSRCFLPQELQTVVGSVLRAFPEDLVDHLEQRPLRARRYELPKILELRPGVVVYDSRIAAKQPDWSYLERPLAS